MSILVAGSIFICLTQPHIHQCFQQKQSPEFLRKFYKLVCGALFVRSPVSAGAGKTVVSWGWQIQVQKQPIQSFRNFTKLLVTHQKQAFFVLAQQLQNIPMKQYPLLQPISYVSGSCQFGDGSPCDRGQTRDGLACP